HLDNDVLATYPRDEVRGVVLKRKLKLSGNPSLTFDAGTDAGRAWELNVYANNTQVLKKIIEAPASGGARAWQKIEVDLKSFANQETTLRLYQRVLLANKTAGNAYWRSVEVK